MESWCEHWNIKINDDKNQAIYDSHRQRSVEAYLTLKGRQITFVNDVKYLCVIFDKKNTRRIHIEPIAVKVLRTFITIYLPFEKWALKRQYKINSVQSID
jgi:hypothetical protein